MWRKQAACFDPDVDPGWFDSAGKGLLPVSAMRICRGCPVRDDCLTEVLSMPASDDDGVWGGTTPLARLEVRQGRTSKASAMRAGDRIAERRTGREIAAEDEPWLEGRVA